MPTDITVTELQETVTVTGGTTSITVTGDTATVAVATTTQTVNVVDETNSFVINTVTNKSDIGLGNVDNTSDLDKPISNPTKLYVDTEIDNLTTADIEENGNLYYTQARADARVAAGIAAIDYPVDSVNGKTNTVVLTTSDIAEGTNQYFTTARARSSVSGTGSIAYNSTTGVISYTGGSNPTTTDELPEGTTNLYYTSTRANSDFDTRLATKTTSNLNEGTNLYYTTSRANGDFDTRLATKSTTNLAEGTNLYYTTARSNTDFDGRLATKSTTDLAEGTNLYYTDARARTAISGSTGIAYDNTTGVIAVDTTIATKTYADNAATSAANSAVAALVDSAPATLDTLNELAAALGDDANFATTITTALGQKLNTADFETAFDGHLAEKTTDDLAQGITNKYYASSLFNADLATKTTSDLAEGTNLYYTDARARAAVSGGTGVTYSNSTGVIAIGQSVATTADVAFNTVNANITDDNYVLGQLIATRNTAYVPPASPLTTLAGLNGFVVVSGNGGLGYAPNISIRQHVGDTTAGTAVAGGISMSSASGTNTSPTGTANNAVIGTLNYDGYTAGTSNNYANIIATTNQGGGTSSITPLQAQAYARQAFTNSTTVTTAVTGASGTGATATLTFTTQNTAPYAVGQTVTVAGMTPSGYNGTYVITAATTSSISYANATTGFTSGGTIGAANTVTAAGMGFRIRGYANSTPLTVANRFNFMDLTASAATFKSNSYTFANEVITGSTLTATNYMTIGSTGITAGNVDGVTNFVRTSGATAGTRPVAILKNTVTATTTPANNDGASFRFQAQGSNGTAYHLAQFSGVYSTTGDTAFTVDIANGNQTGAIMTVVQPLAVKLSSTTIRATTTPTATAGGNTLNDIAVFSDAKILNNRPHRSAVTTATVARGSTYTPAATVNNFIELTLTAGTDPTYIDVDNLTVAGEGGHQAILVYNNSGTSIGNGDLIIRNNGTQINDLQSTVASGSRVIFTVYCIGNYASCEYMHAA